MRIVHLVTSAIGGAALAARRLNECLLLAGQDSHLVSVRRRKSIANEEFLIQDSGIMNQFGSSATTLMQKVLIQRGVDPVTPISLNTIDWSDPIISSADVLHLHAFYNLVSIDDFLTKYPEKVKVVTFHDERFLSGGCHNSYECPHLSLDCMNCPQVHIPFRWLIHRSKIKTEILVNKQSNICFICPSQWILDRARLAFPEVEAHHFRKIYNPIPKSNQSPIPQLNRDYLNVGFVSQDLDNPRKNLDLLLRAFFRIIDAHPKSYFLHLFGSSKKNNWLSPIFVHGTLSSTSQLYDALNSIDVLVVPSTHDNLPNVLGEALMCGVGIIGSDAGGIPEITKLFEQKSFRSGNEDELVNALLEFRQKDRQATINRAESIFGYDEIARQMVQVYESELFNSR